jgi:hypothetical protein
MIGDRDVDDLSTSCSRITRTNSSRNVTVGTTNKSAAMIWLA